MRRNYMRTLLLGISMLIAMPMNIAMAAESDFSEDQKTKIEKIVHDYMIGHPEVLVEAARSLEKKQQLKMVEQAQTAIMEKKAQLFDSKSPMTGNAKGNVTVVEFFDYQCSHCKKMHSVVDQLVKADKNLRVVFKELPIFGPSSEYTARAALAAQKQGKYLAFHEALMAANQPMNEARVLKIAASVGLDTKKLQEDMKQADVKKELEENLQIAQALRLAGTPAFVVSRYPVNADVKTFFIPGATTIDALQKMIGQAREGQASAKKE